MYQQTNSVKRESYTEPNYNRFLSQKQITAKSDTKSSHT